jgi:hypothetical protein
MMLHLISQLPSAQVLSAELAPAIDRERTFLNNVGRMDCSQTTYPLVYTPYIYDREAFCCQKYNQARDVIPISSRGDRILGTGCKRERGRRKRRCVAAFTQKTNALGCKERYNDREKF